MSARSASRSSPAPETQFQCDQSVHATAPIAARKTTIAGRLRRAPDRPRSVAPARQRPMPSRCSESVLSATQRPTPRMTFATGSPARLSTIDQMRTEMRMPSCERASL